MDINKSLLKSIHDSMNCNGLDIELSKNFKSDFFNVPEELEKGMIRIYTRADYIDSNMFLYTFGKMLENNEVTITFNENANKKYINYLENLSEEF